MYFLRFFTGLLAPRGWYGFHVQLTKPSNIAPPAFNIEFDRVLTNFGGMWDTLMHNFIAPVKGLYVFHLHVVQYTTPSNSLNAWIMKDGNRITMAYVRSVLHNGVGSASAVIEMEPLNRAYCRLEYGRLNEGFFTSFTGFLLQQLP